MIAWWTVYEPCVGLVVSPRDSRVLHCRTIVFAEYLALPRKMSPLFAASTEGSDAAGRKQVLPCALPCGSSVPVAAVDERWCAAAGSLRRIAA